MKRWKVSQGEEGMTLSSFLAEKMQGELSKRQIKLLMESNACERNGRVERFASKKVGKGDQIAFFWKKGESMPEKNFAFEKERLLFEDDDLLLYNKAAGLASDGKTALEGILKDVYPEIHQVHRLDKDTSGVILFAKKAEVARALEEEFRQRKVKKRYLALVDGIVEEERGVIRNYLGRLKDGDFQGQKMWGSLPREKGKKAETAWRIFERGEDFTALTCFPKTGRTHQIRVHLAEMGHPILGDAQYGKRFRSKKRPRHHLLHAEELSFFHPLKKEILSIQSPIPPAIANLLTS